MTYLPASVELYRNGRYDRTVRCYSVANAVHFAGLINSIDGDMRALVVR